MSEGNGSFTNEEILKLRKDYIYPTKNAYYSDPVQLVRAKGSRVWDNEGREYLDIIGGIVSISVGHNHPRIVSRIRKMLENDTIQHTTHLFLSEYMAELGRKLAEQAPGDVDKCYFTNSGSESNELAVMSARVATGSQTIIGLRQGYHGGTAIPMAVGGQHVWKFPSQPTAAVVHAVAPYCYRCPFGKTRGACHLECAEDIKDVIETTTSGRVAGLIVEPILGVGGFIDPPVEYHKRAAEIVRSFGGKYISDEVQTGSGRLGKHFFAIEESGVVPDIITTAKGFGNGAPIGAVVAKTEVAESLRGMLHFNTFGGDPYQSMQAAETIDIIMDEKLIENAAQMGNHLKDGLRELQNRFPVIGDVRGRGLLVGFELVKDPVTKEPAPKETVRIMELAKNNQLLIGKGGMKGNVIRLAPPLNITKDECDEVLTKLRSSFEAL
ncbi:MAG: aspartate aminotransferase family protein, partial [bacterium]|nr:aspartate aminotransferase family protein [bacterium]